MPNGMYGFNLNFIYIQVLIEHSAWKQLKILEAAFFGSDLSLQ